MFGRILTKGTDFLLLFSLYHPAFYSFYINSIEMFLMNQPQKPQIKQSTMELLYLL